MDGFPLKETLKNHPAVTTPEFSMNSELVNQLRELGLNQYEAQAYLALSLGGPKTAGDIADTGNIARPRVYDVLEKLQQKGFAAIKSGRPVQFAAVPLEEAVKTLKKHKELTLIDEIKKIEEMSGRLSKQLGASEAANRFQVEENVWTLKGRNAIYSRIAQMVDRSKENVVICSPPDNVSRKIKENLESFQKAKSRGVKVSIVSAISKLADKRHAIHSPNSHINQVAHAVLDRHVPTRMLVADDEALLFLTEHTAAPEDEVGLWVKSPHLAKTLKELASK